MISETIYNVHRIQFRNIKILLYNCVKTGIMIAYMRFYGTLVVN